MSENRVKFSSIVENQLPAFVREDFPLIGEFLSEYYRSVEYKSAPVDLINNIDQYIKVDNLTNLIDNTLLSESIDFLDTTINVESTLGFPDSYGLIQINSEVISYKSKTDTSFVDCVRGFSGITSYKNETKKDSLVFSTTSAENHEVESAVINLNIQFLKIFLTKIKTQFTPGFENVELNPNINQNIFIKQAKDFYSSKGTEDSFKILFKALYGDENISVIRPADQLLIPSNSDWRVTLDLVVEAIIGNPFELLNKTISQFLEDGVTPFAYGTVNNVEEFQRDDVTYYKLSLDYGVSQDISVKGSVFGEFYINPSTKTTTKISVGNTHIDVDSTVAFPESGQLLLIADNIDIENDFIVIEYGSKSLTQFLNTDPLPRSFPENYTVRSFNFAIGEDNNGNEILLHITGVLSELSTPFGASNVEPGDIAIIETLGIEYFDARTNSWLYNIPTTNQISYFTDAGNLRYDIVTIDPFLISPGEFVDLTFLVQYPNGSKERITKEFEVSRGSIPNTSFKVVNNYPILEVYSVTKKITKVKDSIINANVQNTYIDYDNNVYVASPALPNYFNNNLDTKVNEVFVSGSFSSNSIFTSLSDHKFIDGESVVFLSLSNNNDIDIPTLTYYVKVVDQTKFKLSASLSNLNSNIFISFTGIIESGKFVRKEFFTNSLDPKQLEPQNIIRRIGLPKNSELSQPILPNDAIGILNNGVEIVTYKTKDSVYYGPLSNIEVLSSGQGYDVISPPNISIVDGNVGSGASAYCSSMIGKLVRVDIIDGGFDYLDVPTITITGGSSLGAKCQPELISFEHIMYFSSTNNINLITNTISFSEFHKFRDGEEVIYNKENDTSVGNLVPSSIYYVSVINSNAIKLHASSINALEKIEEIDISSYGEGTHSLRSTAPKSKISSVKIISDSLFYSKKIIVNPDNIDILSNKIYYKDHEYSTGEELIYSFEGTPISGLSTSQTYYVSVVDENNFKLALKETLELEERYLLNTQQFVEFNTKGSGKHIFNYPKITLNLSGKVGVSTLSGEDYQAKLTPIIRGAIFKVSLENSGVGYGSSDILNYHRKPSVQVIKGSGAQLTPIVSNYTEFGRVFTGRISDVIVNSFGKGYTYGSIDIKVNSKTGVGAKLVPVINEENGSIVDIIIESAGFNYNINDTIDVLNSSQNCILDPIVTSWNINRFDKKVLQNEIFSDDGTYIESPINNSLQYVHLYAPRKLRDLLYSTKFEDDNTKYKTDLENDNGNEFHSPIIGWAYDGNPIYGPYAYDNPSGGKIKQMVSSYVIKESQNRPANYPLGFFVEDYVYIESGDLDEYNGRFCITPEYPFGTYAYFATLSKTKVTGGPFDGFKIPVFPYFIGSEFKNEKDFFNYNIFSNQSSIDLNQTSWRRNVSPYNLNRDFSSYDYLVNPNRIKRQLSTVQDTIRDKINSISVVSAGSSYKVGDIVLFDNDEFVPQFSQSFLNPRGQYGKISEVTGKSISDISTSELNILNIELETTNLLQNGFIGISTQPHNFNRSDLVRISGVSTSALRSIDNYQFTIPYSNELILRSAVGPSSITGIVTYFNITNTALSDSAIFKDVLFRENDIYEVDNEKIKVLKVDNSNSRIKVLREYDNSVGTSHSIYSKLSELSRKFNVTANVNDFEQSFKSDREFYFDPSESVGLGTTSGVGIGSILNIINPGAGSTQILVPSGLIYLQDHTLKTNDKIIYYENGGSPLEILINQIPTDLNNIDSIYAIKINDNFIGISTVQVGLNTLQEYVGIDTTYSQIYFTGIGTGNNHSFKTEYPNTFLVDAKRRKVTVTTEENHGILVNDFVKLNSTPNLETIFTIKYNDFNRRLISNPVGFTSENVSPLEDSIFIENHNLFGGQKVIHISDNSAGGLENNKIYYVCKINDNNIALSTSYFNSLIVYGNFDRIVDITSQSYGELYQINPQFVSPRNNKVTFNLSDSSLSYIQGSNVRSAFTFDLYTDQNFKNKFISSNVNSNFETKKNGIIGISSDARYQLTLNNLDNVPYQLYYKLTPVKDDILPDSKKEYLVDYDFIKYSNQLVLPLSIYNGQKLVSGVGSTSFYYYDDSNTAYEPSSYIKSDGQFKYVTSSKNTLGGVSKVKISSFGDYNYLNLPTVSEIVSETGSGCLLRSNSKKIGVPSKIKIDDIGFSYPIDFTLRPTAKLPYILNINIAYSLDEINIIGLGTNYTIFPNLLIKDSLTNEIFDKIVLDYLPETNKISILENVSNLSNIPPKVIPINNTNGYSIKDIEYDQVTKIVTVTFNTSFSYIEDFPFIIGDKFLIENVTSNSLGNLGKSFNSSYYNYELFEVLSTDPNIGGSNASLTYSVSRFVSENETLGEYDSTIPGGLIIPEKYFPIFEVKLKTTDFIVGELVRFFSDSGTIIGRVERWYPENRRIKLLSPRDVQIGDIIEGISSKTVATVLGGKNNTAIYNVSSSSIVEKGWNSEYGRLNDSLQNIHDSFYYQYFSYSVKSKIPYDNWEKVVNGLNHTAGFKKFSDLSIESKDLQDSGISTSQNLGEVSVISDLVNIMDLECIDDFDLVYDDVQIANNNIIASNIIFNNRVLQDYQESIGNRVLVVDNISGDFNSDPRATPYAIVDSFRLEDVRSKKFILFVRDKRFVDERQIYLATLLHDGTFGYINQYGRIESDSVLGSFEFTIFDVEGRLLFYPINFTVNNYDISFLSYDTKDGFIGIGSTNFGNIVEVNTEQSFVVSGITTTIASIPLDYRSSKLIIQIQDSNNEFHFNEISVIHDGSDVSILEYGDFSSTITSSSTYIGFGTFNAYISDSNLNIDLIPSIAVNAVVDSAIISIASSISGNTDVGVVTFNTSKMESFYVSAASTETYPIEVASYLSGFYEYNGGYGVISIEDLSNQQYQVSEYTIISDSSSSGISEFGILYTNSEIGILTTFNNGLETKILFTPYIPADLEIRVLQHSIGPTNILLPFTEIDLTNYEIREGFSEYVGTDQAIRRSFDLFYKQNPIFQKEFVGSSTSVVDIENDIIKLPQHFFVTGEKVLYSYNEITSGPIGIATTTITGIGLTDTLPEELYIIKLSDLEVKVARSVEESLKLVPIPIKLRDVGIGSDHFFTSTNQNPKVVVTVDNMLQSPIVSTAITSFLADSISTIDDIIPFGGNNIRSFIGGDLIKIDDEIMRVSIVGYGSTSNIYVNRPWLGTTLQPHSQNSLITKVVGNYNIVDNTLNFASAPYGPKPIGDQNSRPDSRDFSGITTYSTFSGRVFLRSGLTDSSIEPYTYNYVLDDIADQFNGITSSFTLKTNRNDVVDISESNAIIAIKDIFQPPSRSGALPIEGSYSLEEDGSETNILFTGNEYTEGVDIETTGLPVGGKIVSIGSTKGFGYQPLVSAGGTALVSISGTIQSINLTNYGSGYRVGVQTYVNVGVQTYSNEIPNIEYIGYGSIDNGRIVSVTITNSGTGYTYSNPPKVVFDEPLSYSNLELIYSQLSIGSTLGSNAKVDIVVGQGSSVIDFELRDVGFGYQVNNSLTVSIGGTIGIPREYRGRYVDAANLLSVNKEFIKNEVVGFITTTYPAILSNPDYDETICKRDIGYIVDAVSHDIAFGGNFKCIEAGNAYWSGIGTNYVSGESTETIGGYEYIVGISSYIINNITVPISYQTGTIVTQIQDISIQYDEDCSALSYSSNCCNDVWLSIGNCVGIITSIIGIGTSSSPQTITPYSNPILELPTILNFEEFQISVDKIFSQEFTGWTIGDLEIVDNISNLFDGRRRGFPIKFEGVQQSIKAKIGSQIDVQATLLIFVNDVLQVPGESYLFSGGSIIRFTEAPRSSDTCTILFYKGTGDIDVKEVDVLETIKKGDKVQIKSDLLSLNQKQRSVKEIIATDTLETYPYVGVGVVNDIDLKRPIKWCRQRNDIFIDGSYVTKDRELYESLINPFTNIIYDIGAGTSVAYVESIRTFFDYKKENADENYINTIDIFTQDEVLVATARAVVSTSGTISEIVVENGGFGYLENPEVSIQRPPEFNTPHEMISILDVVPDESRAVFSANIIDGSVSSINVENGGSGYDPENLPLVLIANPKSLGETAFRVEYEGDFGSITGIGTTIVGVSSLAIIFELSIDDNSPLRNVDIVENTTELSGIKTDYYFIAKNTTIGLGVTSLNTDLTIIIEGKEYIDNVYQVYDINDDPYIVSVSEVIVNLVRYGSYSINSGSTVVVDDTGTLIVENKTKVVCLVENYNGLDSIIPPFPEFESRILLGEYTWGRIDNMIRPYPESYSIYRDNGITGISSFPIIRRSKPLRYQNYLP